MTSEDREYPRFHRGLSADDLGGDAALGRLVAAAAMLGRPVEEVAFEAACREFAAHNDMSLEDAALCLLELERLHATDGAGS